MAAQEIVILGADGITEHVFPAGFDPKRAAAIVRGQAAPAAPQVPAGPPAQTLGRFAGEAWKAVKPWDKPADIVQGPLFAARHPLQAIELLFGALKDAHRDQGSKAVEAARAALREPSMGGKMQHASEAMARGAATLIPGIGPAVASGVEMMAEGDVAGGAGRLTGLGASAVAGPKVVAAAHPVRQAVAGRLASSARAQMGRALNPTRIDTKVDAQRVVPEMLQRRVSAPSLERLEQRAAAASDKAGEAVGAQLAKHGDTTADVMPIVEQLEQAKQPYIGRSTDGRAIVNEAAPVKAIQELQDTLMNYGDRISVASMAKLRRNWDDTVKASRGFVVSDLGTKWAAWARREGRSALRDELGKAVPDIAALNAEYTFWQRVEDIAHATNERRTGQSRSLLPTIAATGGAIAGDALTGGMGTATKAAGVILSAKAAASLKRLFESPGWQMMSAVHKQRLADALMGGHPQLIADAIGRTAAMVNTLERSGARVPAPAMPMAQQQERR